MIALLQRTRMVIIKNPCTLLTRNVHNLYILKTTTVNGQPIFKFSAGAIVLNMPIDTSCFVFIPTKRHCIVLTIIFLC